MVPIIRWKPHLCVDIIIPSRMGCSDTNIAEVQPWYTGQTRCQISNNIGGDSQGFEAKDVNSCKSLRDTAGNCHGLQRTLTTIFELSLARRCQNVPCNAFRGTASRSLRIWSGLEAVQSLGAFRIAGRFASFSSNHCHTASNVSTRLREESASETWDWTAGVHSAIHDTEAVVDRIQLMPPATPSAWKEMQAADVEWNIAEGIRRAVWRAQPRRERGQCYW